MSEASREKSQKRLSVKVVRLSFKVCYLHLYTIKLLSFSYISAELKPQFGFIKLLEPIKDDR